MISNWLAGRRAGLLVGNHPPGDFRLNRKNGWSKIGLTMKEVIYVEIIFKTKLIK